MTLREFYDWVLDFIETSSLTDEEFDKSPIDIDPDYNQQTFDFLKLILSERESVSDTYRRLYNLYYASGAIEQSKPDRAQSNIFIGARL